MSQKQQKCTVKAEHPHCHQCAAAHWLRSTDLVYSHLEYAISSWGSASTYLLQTIKTIQNKILRLITLVHIDQMLKH